jgi:uncharacterized protein (TIRG00374 family)
MRALSIGLGVALAAVLLFLSIRGIDWREAAHIVRGASVPRLLVAAALATLALFLRSLRWRILLNATGKVGVATAFWATSVGYAANNFLPARAGELVRTMLISRHDGLHAGYVLTTALAERVVDAIVLVLVSALILLWLPHPPGWLSHAARPFAWIGITGALAIVLTPFLLEAPGRALLHRVPLPDRWRSRLLSAIEQIVTGLRSFHNRERLTRFLSLTAIIWGLDTVGVVITATALGLAIPLAAAVLLITGLSIGSALPSTPGYVGVYQFVSVTVLTPFGLSRTDAIAYILVAQVLMYVVLGVWASVGMAQYRSRGQGIQV